jgi:2-polyprenyl-3-methyl-5-hydroxy-6-metoxy-1,4-benzoquinol methylase
MKQWYEQLFTNYAQTYDKETFIQGTVGEVDFIEKEIGYDKTKLILDIGCGTGRHSIELAKRGYIVTGIDLSENQLNRAKEKATSAGVKVEFHRADACHLKFNQEFDIALSICEGGFPLMENDDKNYSILQSASRALKENGKLILTTLNGLYPLYHQVKDLINENPAGVFSVVNNFDLMTFRDISTIEVTDDDGNVNSIECTERYYVPSEMTWLLKSVGFKKVEIFGCSLGAFSRNDILTVNEYEMLIVAEK